jgi:hypothetical protein
MGFYNTAGVQSIKAAKGSRNIKSIGCRVVHVIMYEDVEIPDRPTDFFELD